MKQILQGKNGVLILSAVAGLVVAVGLWELFDVGNWYRVRTAVRDLARGANMARSRETLETLNDRAYVLEKLAEAVEDDSYGIRAKSNLLTELSRFNQPRAIRRALDSRSITTQRAACNQVWGDPELKTRCGEIALAWLKEDGAEERSTAAAICGHLGIEEAEPVLLGIVAKDPTTEGERMLFQRALAAIKDPKPPQLVERLFVLASDAKMDRDVRSIALQSVQRVKDGPKDRVLELSIRILGDANEDDILRTNAALGLRQFPEDRAWQALEAVLLSDKETNRILQANCLRTLGEMAPPDPAVGRRYIDRLRQLLVDRRVYGNPYFPIRAHVATALGALNARDPITLDIMGDYLVDVNPDDKEHLVPQAAWMTLWMLTGTKLPDLPEPELFANPPPQPFHDPLAARDYLFVSRNHHRPGISTKQGAMVAKIAGDPALMKKTREVYKSLRAQILETWRVEAEAKQARAAGNGPPHGPPGNGGPQAPEKEEKKGPGEEKEPEKGK
jgi:hypothetical protein